MRATSMLSSLGYAGLRATRLPALTRRLRNGGVVLCYHNVVQGRHIPSQGDPGLHLPRERFGEQLRWLTQRYTIVPLEEMVVRMRAGLSLRGTCALTFDDAYLGVVDHAVPLLRAQHLPATLFVIGSAPDRRTSFWWDRAGAVEDTRSSTRHHQLQELRGDQETILRSMSRDRTDQVPGEQGPAGWAAILAASAQGMALGAHSHTHRALPTLDGPELQRELTWSRETIEARTGTRPALFAYPYGLWDGRVREAVRAAGYTGAVTLDRGVNGPRTDPWALRRVNVPANLENAAFECWAAGLFY